MKQGVMETYNNKLYEFGNNVSPENSKLHGYKYGSSGNDLWCDGLLCAFEFIPYVRKKVEVGGKFGNKKGPVKGTFTAEINLANPLPPTENPEALRDGQSGAQPSCTKPPDEHGLEESSNKSESRDGKRKDDQTHHGLEESGDKNGSGDGKGKDRAREDHPRRNQWVPIGWPRISQLVLDVQRDSLLSEDMMIDDTKSDDGDSQMSVADQAAPYWQVPIGPIWWCHVHAGHPHIVAWLAHAAWLHPAISSALRDESRLISERMKHLFYEVPVRVGGGLLFELLGQSVGDPHRNEDDVPIVLRSWTSLNFLITALHVKGEVLSGLNVIGLSEVQDIVGAGGSSAPRTAHEVVALLADRLARWDDRLYRKHFFGEADEVELKFVSRAGDDDLLLLGIILNQEIRRLSSQVIRVKWSLHAREEILYELVSHLRGKTTQAILAKIAQSTREMLDEQEAVRDRLFTVQDVMQNTLRAKLQDKSVRIQHNLAIVGGGSLFLSILVGLFGVNLDGIPGGENTPYAFGVFTAILFTSGFLIVWIAMTFLGFKKPPTELQLQSRKLELADLVKKFQMSAEGHEKVKEVDHPWSGANKRSLQGSGDPHVKGGDYILVG